MHLHVETCDVACWQTLNIRGQGDGIAVLQRGWGRFVQRNILPWLLPEVALRCGCAILQVFVVSMSRSKSQTNVFRFVQHTTQHECEQDLLRCRL